jgi:hypothetical protein
MGNLKKDKARYLRTKGRVTQLKQRISQENLMTFWPKMPWRVKGRSISRCTRFFGLGRMKTSGSKTFKKPK